MAVRKARTPARVVRVHEAQGSSRRGWEAAAADALKRAKAEVSSPIGLEVGRLWADVRAGKPTLYHAQVRIAYGQGLKSPEAIEMPTRRARQSGGPISDHLLR